VLTPSSSPAPPCGGEEGGDAGGGGHPYRPRFLCTYVFLGYEFVLTCSILNFFSNSDPLGPVSVSLSPHPTLPCHPPPPLRHLARIRIQIHTKKVLNVSSSTH